MEIYGELALILFLLGLTIFILFGSIFALRGYGKRAIQAGFSTSLIYFGLLLLVVGTYSILSIGGTSGYSLFAIGFALTAFGYNGFLNLEQSRRIHEILMHIRYESSKLKYQDSLSYENCIVLSIIMIIWSASIAVITGITSDYYAMAFGLIIIICSISCIVYSRRKLPVKIDNNLCQGIINQINEQKKKNNGENVFKNMSWNYQIALLCGTALLVIGGLYLVISFIFFSYKLSPIDFISTGMGFIGLAIAMNEWQK